MQIMDDILHELISLSIEFEGNLRVAAARDSAEALSAARDKFGRMSALMEALGSDSDVKAADDVKNIEAEEAEKTPDPEPTDGQAPDEPVVETDCDAVMAAEDEPVEDEPAEDEPAEGPGDDSDAVPADTVEEAPAAKAEAVTLGDTFTARNACDLRKAFTLNDKFLFRRELFGGSETEFADTIELITAMHSYDEAVEYLIDDLQWDGENTTVKDFLSIVAAYFKSRN